MLPDNDALIVAISLHVSVSVVPDCEYVRRKFSDFLIFIQFNLFRRVDGQDLIRIHGHQNGSGVGLEMRTKF